MTRSAFVLCGLFLLAACSGTDDTGPAVPTASLLVDDAGGDPYEVTVSPDGTRLAWAQPVDGQAAIFVANVDGSDRLRLTHGVWDQVPVWSPDGQSIAYHAEAPDYDVFVVNSTGGESRQLTSGPSVDYPWYWLEDGSGVVFRRSGSGADRTLVVTLEDRVERPLVPPQAGNQYVVLSPDGARALIGVERGDGNTIWLRDMASGEPTQLTREGLEVISNRPWSPDGRSVLFESRRTGTTDVWVGDVQTGELRQITTDIHNDGSARWSPDSQWVLFLSDRGGQTDLWIVSAAGGQPRRVTNDLAVEDDHGWSPDGRTIYFTSSDNAVELQAIPLDGATPRTLVAWSGYDIGDADVSPDGRTVLLESNRSGSLDLWSMQFDAGEPTPLTASPLDDVEPDFSPDGGTIAFNSSRAGSADIWLMPVTGGEATRLTDWPSAESVPRWSPDGTLIAFLSDRDADRPELWVMRADGGEARRLSNNLGDVVAHGWSPDGSEIYFIGAKGAGTRDLYRVSVSGGEPQPLGANKYIGEGDLSPDGSQYAYAVFEAGWGYIEVMPTAGGQPRRLTTRTERVFQNSVSWTPDGTALIIVEYDYPGDTYDLQIVTWPEGEWQPLTRTSKVDEFPSAFTADSRQVIGIARTHTSRIMSVPVVDLLANSPE